MDGPENGRDGKTRQQNLGDAPSLKWFQKREEEAYYKTEIFVPASCLRASITYYPPKNQVGRSACTLLFRKGATQVHRTQCFTLLLRTFTESF